MENQEESGLEKITDTIGELVTGIPAPIRKNFFKAFAQLCTAAVDVPVAKLEGKAAEIRAESRARIQILNKEGEQISEQLKVPKEYVDRASQKFASKVIKEQLNLDEIGMQAANNLKNEKYKENKEENVKEIDDDWLNEFENSAKLKSSNEMKMIFGKILSGEIKNPGSFSVRTIQLLSQLDNQAAILFQKLCSQSISMLIGGSHLIDARVASLDGNPSSNSLRTYGLSFDNLNVLLEYGLIISDYNSWLNYSPCIINENMSVSAAICFGKYRYGLMPTDREKYDKNVKLNGVALTKAGKELLTIIPLKEEDSSKYKSAFEEFLAKKHLKLIQIGK
ncbi:uncharacterized protein DUF2806 [Algoriphagus ratkowskyi]|uniref:DUF2806 domain-containing protein n=1 Tax=Algoriphagus ratkowskyi TaxID=57028 RepID=A0A2W7RVA8_9BACT|nr:DUF2806 domain-containing protein [Algoriphagus ratkowskyi]PZX59147.1 uncharacterized protein DUF2806 [Algoriphagus ratkowskyi]TXD77567.1 DUF2806 domain-containing protein [Algoriphagus ratkowskyi]